MERKRLIGPPSETGSAVWSLATRRIFYKDKPYAMEAVLLSQDLRIARIYR